MRLYKPDECVRRLKKRIENLNRTEPVYIRHLAFDLRHVNKPMIELF